MSVPSRFTKTTSDVDLLAFEYARTQQPYLNSGEIITEQSVVTIPTGAVGISSVTTTGSEVFFYVSSGTVKAVCEVLATVRTSYGRVAVRSFTLEVVPSKWGRI